MQEDGAAHTALDAIPVGGNAFVYWSNVGTPASPRWRLFLRVSDEHETLAELSVHENDAAALAETILRHAVTGPIPLTDGINIQ